MTAITGPVAWICSPATGEITGYRRKVNGVYKDFPFPLPNAAMSLADAVLVPQPLWITNSTTGAIEGYRRAIGNLDVDYNTYSGVGTAAGRVTLGVQWLANIATGEIIGYRTTNADGSITDRSVAFGATLLLDFTNTSTLDPRITFTRSTTATFTDSNGLLQTAAIDAPRFDYNPVTRAPLGLLIEEQRTNTIRNNTMVGAVAGTPGTLPTNWGIAGAITGLTTSIVGAGMEAGISYVDIRFVGTAGGALNPNILFDTSTAVAAANGQAWTWSSFVSVVGGSTSNVTSIIPVLAMFSSVPFLVGTLSGSPFVPTGASLVSQRLVFTGTLNQASTAFVRPQLQFSVANGAAIDITLRIGLPQLELGAFATSVIPTVASQVTRAADVATMTGTNFSDWYNQAEGTLYVEGDTGGGTLPCFASIDDGTTGNRIQLRRSNNDTHTGLRMVSPGGSIDVTLISGTAASVNKQAASFSAGNQNAAANGVLFTGITSIPTMPTVTRMDIGAGVGSTILNGHIHKIAYYPRSLSNAALQGITS